jgi:hypothetical protein
MPTRPESFLHYLNLNARHGLISRQCTRFTQLSLCSNYRIYTWKAALFLKEFTLQNWGVAYARNIMSFWQMSPQRRYCMLWNSQYRPLMLETVILQAAAQARIHQRIIGVSAYFDYTRVANTNDSRSWKIVTSLTNYHKCC